MEGKVEGTLKGVSPLYEASHNRALTVGDRGAEVFTLAFRLFWTYRSLTRAPKLAGGREYEDGRFYLSLYHTITNMGLVELPDDVLLLVYSYLTIQDVLALKQVSLVHAHTTADTPH